MSRVKTSPTIEDIIDDMHQLSDDEQRSLAAAIMNDRKLEPLVEELDDSLSCERAVEEGPAEALSN